MLIRVNATIIYVYSYSYIHIRVRASTSTKSYVGTSLAQTKTKKSYLKYLINISIPILTKAIFYNSIFLVHNVSSKVSKIILTDYLHIISLLIPRMSSILYRALKSRSCRRGEGARSRGALKSINRYITE